MLTMGAQLFCPRHLLLSRPMLQCSLITPLLIPCRRHLVRQHSLSCLSMAL